MNGIIRFTCVSLFAMVGGTAVADGLSEAEVRRAEARARAVEMRLDDVRSANRLMRKRSETLAVTADLISGRRASPPRSCVTEREVARLCETPVTIDNRSTGERKLYEKWVSLKGGRTYRATGRLEVREISGTQNLKFGAMVPRRSKSTEWPDAFIGGSPFAEKEVSFSFYLADDGGVLILVGFENGKGLAVLRDLRILEVSEVTK